jgi:hypothetical protein
MRHTICLMVRYKDNCMKILRKTYVSLGVKFWPRLIMQGK